MSGNTAVDDGVITVTEESDNDQGNAPETAQADAGSGEGSAQSDAAEGDAATAEGEVVVAIGEDPPPSDDDEFHGKPAPEWVKNLRKEAREDKRRIRELEAKLSETAAPAKAPEVGDKPTLESCDFDGERFEAELLAWNERKRKADEAKEEQAKQEQAARDAWQAKLDGFEKAKKALKVSDYEEAEAKAQDVLTPIQQAVIVNGAENPALLVYALGKHPAKAKELAAITDPVKFAFAVAKLETQLKVAPRKAAPLPEEKPNGTGRVTDVDQTLERLRAEADRTGDRSKVAAYIRKQRARA
jgi:hypothetical protein